MAKPFMALEESTNTIQKIGRYRITGELGRGGMGVVYHGEDRLIGRRVAIKTLTEVTPELRERFSIEARSGILNHQNIVTVYEVGEHEGSPFIVMEFVDGDSLEKMLRQRKRLPLLEVLSIVEQLCAGLGYAHGHGVVHRDVKPANVLVRPDGRVTIVDFGIARLADQTRQLTKTDKLLGTFHYIAPERLKGETSDGRADIWSVGVMLYEMLTGELPFKGSDLSSLYRVIHEPYVPIAEHIEGFPDGLNRILDKALAKEVDARYETAEEMAFDVQVLGEGLKHDRVGALLETARRLTEENQYSSARTVLLQAQRIDPGNIYAKTLLGDVQDRLSEVQRGDQLRQVIDQAQDAANNQQWDEAVVLFQRARKLDTENAFDLDERLQQAQKQKVQQQRVLELWKQADEARSVGDLTKAQDYLGQALQVNDRSTELRNAYSDVLREIRRKQQQLRVESLLRNAREESGRRRYADAISYLREAAEIDPTHAEVQELLFAVTAQQKEERRQQSLDQAMSDVQESLDRDDFDSARDHATRALELLPGDELLSQLKSEIDSKEHSADIEQAVRDSVLKSQELFADHPEQALQVIEEGLKRAPESQTLLQSRARLLKHLEQDAGSPRAQEPKEVQTALNGEMQHSFEATTLMRVPGKDLEQPAIAESRRTKTKLQPQNGAVTEEAHEVLQTTQFANVSDHSAPIGSANGTDLTKLSEGIPNKHDETNGKNELTESFTRTPLKDASSRADEIRAAIERAVRVCDDAIAAGDLNHCTRSLDELTKRYGANAALATAIDACKSKREDQATKMLREAVGAAQQRLQSGSPQKADEALKSAEHARSFASADARRMWQQLRGECSAALSAKQPTAKSNRSSQQGKLRWYVTGSVAVVVALVIAGLVYGRRDTLPVHNAVTIQSPPSVSAVLPTDIEINASPWAKVVSVQGPSGKSIPLPDGDRATPLRLDGVESGTYKVTFASDDGREQVAECKVSDTEHLCSADMGLPDTKQMLVGAQP